MKVNKGVEWAAHACALLAVLPEDWALSAEALAEFHDVPPAYMAKQMQALSRAGLVRSTRGAAGGYRLAVPADQISLWDITAAVEGAAPAFRCTEIRQNGPCGAAPESCIAPCGIARSFHQAEAAFREVLKQVGLPDIIRSAAETSPAEKAGDVYAWLEKKASRIESGSGKR